MKPLQSHLADILASLVLAAAIAWLLGGMVALLASTTAVLALVVFVFLRKRGYELPYIPFLSTALFLTWLCDTSILTLLELIYE